MKSLAVRETPCSDMLFVTFPENEATFSTIAMIRRSTGTLAAATVGVYREAWTLKPAQAVVRGIFPILSMPFLDDDSIDFDGLVRQAEFLISTGVDGVGFGFGSEIFRLTDDERDEALAHVSAAVGGRVPIISAASANSTRASVARGLAAKEAGAAVLMITPPAMVAAGPIQIRAHYATIAEQVGLPIIVQDAPGLSGVSISNDVLAELAKSIDLVVAVKIESIPPAPRVGVLADLIGDHASVLGGAGGIDFMHELQRGGDGTIPGAAHPELFTYIWSRFQAGDIAEARRCFNRFLPMLALMWRSFDHFLFAQKEILHRRGVLGPARMRAPSETIDPGFLGELDQMLADLGIAELDSHWDVAATMAQGT
jgi:4-hydroxy-tetrahydrodipicolinate synthase